MLITSPYLFFFFIYLAFYPCFHPLASTLSIPVLSSVPPCQCLHNFLIISPRHIISFISPHRNSFLCLPFHLCSHPLNLRPLFLCDSLTPPFISLSSPTSFSSSFPFPSLPVFRPLCIQSTAKFHGGRWEGESEKSKGSEWVKEGGRQAGVREGTETIWLARVVKAN